MTQQELAERHPRLYHVTEPGAWVSIKKRGLLSTTRLLDLFEVEKEKRKQIEEKRRPATVHLDHPIHGSVIINDNVTLSEKALLTCLDDGLAPVDWFRILNERVFFGPVKRV